MHAWALALGLAAASFGQQKEPPVCFYDSTGRLICVTADEARRILEGTSEIPKKLPPCPEGQTCSKAPAPPRAAETRAKAQGKVPLAAASDVWKYPLQKQWRISSDFGTRTINGKKDWHSGLDIACYAYTPVYAARPGVVEYAGNDTGFGKVVVLVHSDGSKSLYGHISEWLVKKGDKVDHSTMIAKSGNTGHSTGAHLHFEVRDAKDKPVDPAPLIGLTAASTAR